jgi:hydrogenase-4 component F
VEGTSSIGDLRGLLVRRPGLAVPFVVGVVALLGLPPFSLFFSEVAIVVAGVQEGLGWVMALTVFLLLVLFAGIARHLSAIMFGAADRDRPDRSAHGPRLPLVLALGVTAVVGLVAGPLSTLLLDAATVLGATQ